MKNHKLTDKELRNLIDKARFAPSVHNTQPWAVKRTDEGISINIDRSHQLDAGDPVGRQTLISLGIFVEAILLGAQEMGLNAENISFDEDRAYLEFKKGSVINTENIDLLRKRVSDRSIYTKVKLDKKIAGIIEKSNVDKTVEVRLIDEKDFIDSLAHLTSKGIRLALSNPQFRHELSRYLVRPWSKAKRGISVKSLYIPWFLAITQPELLRIGLNTGHEAELEKKRWLSASAVVLISTQGDLHSDWIKAGRTYLRASLAIEKLGLSQATSAATVEAATFHEDVEDMLKTNKRLQAVIRIGKGAGKRQYSPRVSAKELLT